MAKILEFPRAGSKVHSIQKDVSTVTLSPDSSDKALMAQASGPSIGETRVGSVTHATVDNLVDSLDGLDNLGNVVDLNGLIQERGASDRRKAQRVVLGQLIASHAVLPGLGLVQVAVRDIDEAGMAFEMESFLGHFSKGDLVEMRFYLNGQTYFRVEVQVAYSSVEESTGIARHGARFTQQSLNQEALFHFVQFLRSVSVSLRTDRGERVVSNLIS